MTELQVQIILQEVDPGVTERGEDVMSVKETVAKFATLAPSHLVEAGAAVTISGQACDEEMLGDCVHRKVIEAYRDLAASKGVRQGPGWAI